MSKKNRKRQGRKKAGHTPKQRANKKIADAKPDCHTHPVQLVLQSEKQGLSVFAGSKLSVERHIATGELTPTLIINLSGLAGKFAKPFPVTANAMAEGL